MRRISSILLLGLLACQLETSGTNVGSQDQSSAGQVSTVFEGNTGGQFASGGSVSSGGLIISPAGGSLVGVGGFSVLVSTGGVLVSSGGASNTETGGSFSSSTGGSMIVGNGGATGGNASSSATGGVPTGGTTMVAQTGGSVSRPAIELSPDTPVAARVPAGASAVTILRVRLSGDLSSASVVRLQFQDIGTGHRADIVGVYLYDSLTGKRTSSQPITASTKILAFTGLDFAAPTTIAFMADFANTATRNVTHIFEIASASSITLSDGGTIVGTFPIRGNEITIGSPAG